MWHSVRHLPRTRKVKSSNEPRHPRQGYSKFFTYPLRSKWQSYLTRSNHANCNLHLYLGCNQLFFSTTVSFPEVIRIYCVHFSLIQYVQLTSSNVIISLELIQYTNPTHQKLDSECCEWFCWNFLNLGVCDNYISLCVDDIERYVNDEKSSFKIFKMCNLVCSMYLPQEYQMTRKWRKCLLM